MALLIVLGLLGLLLISAVGFAVLMRTERSAATNYRHTSSARHILFAALNRAIEDLDSDIGESLNPDWTADPFHLNDGQRMVRNPEKILFSYHDNPAGEEPVFARILTKDVMTYIPALFHRRLNELDDTYKADVTAPDPNPDVSSCHPEWVPIMHNGSVIGRYAYAIIDTAGLLDASLVHDSATNRWVGGSMREVRLDRDILTRKDILDVADFTADRKIDGRYETIAELAALNTGLDPEKLSNFEVFSAYSTNTWTNTPPVNLYGLATEAQVAAKKTDVVKAFKASGLDGILPLHDSLRRVEDVLYPALIDYVDEDSVMSGGFDRPCTEKLPMLNSFGITMTYTRKSFDTDGDGIDDEFIHTVEHKPMLNFVDWPADESKATDAPFVVKGAIKLYNPMAGKSGLVMDPETGIDVEVYDYGVSPSKNKVDACISGQEPCNPASLVSGGSPDEVVGWLDLEAAGLEAPVESAATPSARAPKLNFTMLVAFEVYNKSGTLCYQFPGNKDQNLFKSGLPGDDFDNTVNWAELKIDVDFQGKIGQPVSVWVECVDPRVAFTFGGFPKKESQWYGNRGGHPLLIPLLSDISGYAPPAVYDRSRSLQYALLQNPALAAEVGLTKTRIDGFHSPAFGGDGKEFDPLGKHFRMHAANAPLQTPGELAYLLCGPWETVKLYDHYPEENPKDDYHRVLDYFEARDPKAVPKGKVNLNSTTEDVLALLYLDMPLRSEKAYKPAPWAAADLAVPLVKASNVPQGLSALLVSALDPFKPINNLSDLAKLYSETSNPVPTLMSRINSSSDKNLGEFEREAVIRNIAGLLTTKQQLFTIILRADAFTTRFGSDKLKDGTVLSSATAVAQVYRDPLPTKDGSGHVYHKTTVRMLKILE